MARHQSQWMVFILASLTINIIISSVHSYTPKVNHRAIAGLWKLTQTEIRPAPTKITFPMKEFTVFPKDKEKQQQAQMTSEEIVEKEILLMLKEDGSFQQYADDDQSQDQVRIPDKLKYHDADDAVLERFMGRIKGMWDLVDGKLILAADRPVSEAEDTLLVGEVVATSEESLSDNPMLKQRESLGHNTSTTIFDTHLSIPQGEVNVGKFIYPRHHPSFFEQPMWRPKPKGQFALKQVLGNLNAKTIEEEEKLVEKFRAKDFYGKKFLLTSHPLGNRKPKGNLRWSIKYNKFVEGPPSQKAKKQAQEEENRPVNIRVMEVMFFANNTFATVGGFAEEITLRGKFHIIGHDRDQLWMQVWRFGFGRSVSGSVFSEGRMLTKEDEKCYWGKICYEDELTDESKDHRNKSNKDGRHTDAIADNEDTKEKNDRRLHVKGSVILGYGLEPLPVARFMMTEATSNKEDFDNEDDDDDEDDDEESSRPDDDGKADFDDWSNAFQ